MRGGGGKKPCDKKAAVATSSARSLPFLKATDIILLTPLFLESVCTGSPHPPSPVRGDSSPATSMAAMIDRHILRLTKFIRVDCFCVPPDVQCSRPHSSELHRRCL